MNNNEVGKLDKFVKFVKADSTNSMAHAVMEVERAHELLRLATLRMEELVDLAAAGTPNRTA